MGEESAKGFKKGGEGCVAGTGRAPQKGEARAPNAKAKKRPQRLTKRGGSRGNSKDKTVGGESKGGKKREDASLRKEKAEKKKFSTRTGEQNRQKQRKTKLLGGEGRLSKPL